MKEFWNQRYQDHPDLYGHEPNEFLKEKLDLLEPGRLLLPGEGEGRNALYAASKGWKVFAFDQSEVAKNNTLEKASNLGIHLDYKVGSAEDMEYPQAHFDLIALVYFHLPPSARITFHNRLVELLKPGGRILVEGFGKRQLEYPSGGPKDEAMLYDLSALQKELPDLEWGEAYDGELELAEGQGHKGNGHVIRLYGRKPM